MDYWKSRKKGIGLKMYIFLLGIVPEVKIAGEPDQAWESLLSLLRFFRRRNLYTALYHWIESFFNESTHISLLLMGCKNHNSLLGIVFPLFKTLSKMHIYTWAYWIWTYLTFIQTGIVLLSLATRFLQRELPLSQCCSNKS